MNSPFGFVVLDKPSGITSHDCVQKVRKIFNIKRVGHGGTLDPAVTGVLPIALGKATRLIPYLKTTKNYLGSIEFGKRTNTDDLEGEIIEQKDKPNLEEDFLNKLLDSFRGQIEQCPPNYSSIHINGERAYTRARRGEVFDISSRLVTIYKLNIVNWDKRNGKLDLNINCSSGTYIRSLARDIGEKIGCGGVLASLRRTEALGFKEKQSIKIESLENTNREKEISIIDPLQSMNHLSKLKLINEQETMSWATGRKIIIKKEQYIKAEEFDQREGDLFENFSLVINHNGLIVGIGEWEDLSTIKPKVVFNAIG